MNRIKLAFAMSALLISNIALADLNTGLVAHWSFDDCTAKDITENGHDGILSENTECSQSILGKGLRLNGSNFVDLGDMNYLSTNSLTFSLWIKKERNGSHEGWLGKWNSAPGPTNNTFLFYNGEQSRVDYPYFVLNLDSSIIGVKGKVKTPLNKFMHIVATWSNVTAQLNIYQDGKLTGTLYNAGKGQSIINGIYEYTAKIGNWGYPHDSSYNFIGLLDDIRLYSRALSASEINDLYNLAFPVSGTVKSLSSHTIICKNETTEQIVNIASSKATNYDCEENGLKVNTGETASIFIKGVVQ